MIHGSLFNKIFFEMPEIDGYRIVQEKNHELKVYIHLLEKDSFDTLALNLKFEIETRIPGIVVEVLFMPEFNPTNTKFKIIESHVN